MVTEPTPCDKGLVFLREHFDERLAAVQATVEARFAGADKAIATAFEAVRESNRIHAEAHAREHHAQQMAIAKAEDAMAIRLEAMNEFRSQLTAERGTYLTKEEFRRVEDAWTRRLDELTKQIEVQGKLWANLQGRGAVIAVVTSAAVGLVVSIVVGLVLFVATRGG
jgi:hypothetical protein